MSLVREWNDLVGGLPGSWDGAQVRVHLLHPSDLDRTAQLLGPLQAIRSSDASLSFRVASDGSGPSTATTGRLLELLDREEIEGSVVLASSTTGEPAPAPGPLRPSAQRLPESWAAELATLPADWSDLLGEIELDSSAYIERAALHLSPVNPRRDGMRLALRFRCARKVGYGASPEMVARCLTRCDEDDIVGAVHVLRVLSDTRGVQTQGPVWQISGQTV